MTQDSPANTVLCIVFRFPSLFSSGIPRAAEKSNAVPRLSSPKTKGHPSPTEYLYCVQKIVARHATRKSKFRLWRCRPGSSLRSGERQFLISLERRIHAIARLAAGTTIGTVCVQTKNFPMCGLGWIQGEQISLRFCQLYQPLAGPMPRYLRGKLGPEANLGRRRH